MDSLTFHYDSVLSDVHMLQPRARHLMTRLNRAGQPVFMSRFRLLPWNEPEDDSINGKRRNMDQDSEQSSEDQETRVVWDSEQSSENQETRLFQDSEHSSENHETRVVRDSEQSSENQETRVVWDSEQSLESQKKTGTQGSGQSLKKQENKVDRASPTRQCPKEKSSRESSNKDQGVLLDQDGDFDFADRRPRRASPVFGRDEVCPVLLSQVGPSDPEDPEDPAEEDSTCEYSNIIRIEHTMATLLEDVGKQVWRGALLLADWVLSEPGAFTGATVLELGAGTGLSSIITASVAKRVYCTDVGEDLLSMCKRNVSLNKHLIEQNGGEVRVRQLDWLQRDLCTDPEQEFSWSEEDMADLYDHTTVIIAADVVYDDDFTDAFFRTLYQLCSSFSHNCDVYISMEKRLNFTLRHMDVCCEAYEHFRLCLQQLEELPGPPVFRVQKVAPSFPQCVMYERVEQLELWKVSAMYLKEQHKTSDDH